MNDSKKKEPRFWERWRRSGAVGSVCLKKPPTNPHVLAAPKVATIHHKGGAINIVKVEGVTAEVQAKFLIGTAYGQDVFHCIFIACRHTENFFERVWCYTIKESEDERYNMEVSFYELKKI